MQPQIACWNSMGASSRERERIRMRTSSQVVVHKHLWIAVDMWVSQFTAISCQLSAISKKDGVGGVMSKGGKSGLNEPIEP